MENKKIFIIFVLLNGGNMCNSCPVNVQILSFHKEKTLLALENDEDFKNGDYHQALLNIAYKEWQMSSDWNYETFIKNTIKEYGELVGFAVLIGKYNQQVGNGGHYQYYDNGYASGDGGCMTAHGDNTEMHDLLLSYFLRNEDLKKKDWYSEFKSILEKFKNFSIDDNQYDTEDCSECYGDGYIQKDSDDEDSDEVRCSNCGGSGDEQFDNSNYGNPVGHDWENLDDRFYAIVDFEKDLNEYFKLKIT